jgi:tetratricopeptide (TPR) repeat protein
MSKTGTWEDVIGPEEADAFVGRVQQLATFREAILQDRPSKLIFYISGQGGAGKTELLKRYQAVARQYRIAVLETDEFQGDVPAVLGHLAAQLKEEGGQDIERFNDKYKRYQQLKAEIESDVDAPQGLAAMIGRTTVRVGLALVKEVPVLRQGSELIDHDVVATQAGEWASYLARKLGNKHDEVALMHEPASILTRLFFADLNALADNRRFLLCFDNYELTRTYLDEWMARLRESKPSWNIRLVIAGRTEPGPTWERLSRAVQHIRLDVFVEAEAEEFLDKVGVTDMTRRQEILDFSGRLPVLMSWLSSTQEVGIDNESPTTDVVELFLRWVKEPSRRRLALLAAVPRRFDLDVLACLDGVASSGSSEADMDWLRKQPWVHQREDGWYYHGVVRRMMVRYQRTRSERAYRAMHKQLAEWYEAKQTGLNLQEREAWRNERWQRYALERIYHHVLVAPDLNWSAFLDLFVHSLRYFRFLAPSLLKLATDSVWEDELRVAERHQLRLFTEQLPVVMERDYAAGFAMFAALCKAEGVSPSGVGIALAYRGEAYRSLHKYEQAMADFDQAIALNSEDAWAIIRRGEVYQEQGDQARALAEFNMAIALNPQDAWAIATRGRTYQLMGEYEQALAHFDQAVALDPKDTWAIIRRGEVYQEQGDHARALAEFNMAIALDPHDAWAIYRRGETYRQQGEYAQALADFDQTVALEPKNTSIIVNRGETYRLQGDYERALADFDRTIGLDPKHAWAIASRGETYLLMGQYERALADFDHAIALESSDWHLYGRALTHRALGQEAAAFADLTAAINGAREEEVKSPDNWQNKLNLAIYYMASRDLTAAEDWYQAAIDAGVNEGRARYAIQDLSNYLHLFPADEAARAMRERLQRYIDDKW